MRIACCNLTVTERAINGRQKVPKTIECVYSVDSGWVGCYGIELCEIKVVADGNDEYYVALLEGIESKDVLLDLARLKAASVNPRGCGCYCFLSVV